MPLDDSRLRGPAYDAAFFADLSRYSSRGSAKKVAGVQGISWSGRVPATLTTLMGSLIKKRRKRMRKKKHKKMLKATRWQRRAGK